MSREEFDCPACHELLVDPVATTCGHTFCRSCILKCLTIRHTCPMCRTELDAHQCRSVNILISNLINDHLPEEIARRREEVAQFTIDVENEERVIRQNHYLALAARYIYYGFAIATLYFVCITFRDSYMRALKGMVAKHPMVIITYMSLVIYLSCDLMKDCYKRRCLAQ